MSLKNVLKGLKLNQLVPTRTVSYFFSHSFSHLSLSLSFNHTYTHARTQYLFLKEPESPGCRDGSRDVLIPFSTQCCSGEAAPPPKGGMLPAGCPGVSFCPYEVHIIMIMCRTIRSRWRLQTQAKLPRGICIYPMGFKTKPRWRLRSTQSDPQIACRRHIGKTCASAVGWSGHATSHHLFRDYRIVCSFTCGRKMHKHDLLYQHGWVFFHFIYLCCTLQQYRVKPLNDHHCIQAVLP